METGQIPVLMVQGRTLPEVWERACLECWEKGTTVATEYDRPGDPPSRDCSMILVIEEPLAEPRIHRAFPAALEDLEIYRQEVVDGVHDHWIVPDEGKWTYTYHERIFSYPSGRRQVNQIDYILKKLTEAPHSRRAQAITWNPETDPPTYDPPCLQRLWFRLLGGAGEELVLNMNCNWRSRDAYKAAFMNIFALTDLQRRLAEQLAERLARPVTVGRYVDMIDSFHIYGSYFAEFEGFLKMVQQRSWEERTWTTEFAQPFFAEGQRMLDKEKAEGR